MSSWKINSPPPITITSGKQSRTRQVSMRTSSSGSLPSSMTNTGMRFNGSTTIAVKGSTSLRSDWRYGRSVSPIRQCDSIQLNSPASGKTEHEGRRTNYPNERNDARSSGPRFETGLRKGKHRSSHEHPALASSIRIRSEDPDSISPLCSVRQQTSGTLL